MIRVLGNSPERVPIKDLDEIIYYKQIKEFTDQEYATSKDLKNAINKHQLTLLVKEKSSRGSAESDGSQVNSQASSLSVRDLKAALREVLPEITKESNASSDIKGAVREIAPLIVEMVRQEVSKMTISGIAPAQKTQQQRSKFMDPHYVPDVDTNGMVGSIESEKRTTSSNNVDDSLAVLRNLKKNG